MHLLLKFLVKISSKISISLLILDQIKERFLFHLLRSVSKFSNSNIHFKGNHMKYVMLSEQEVISFACLITDESAAKIDDDDGENEFA